jgi:hypothetical protein
MRLFGCCAVGILRWLLKFGIVVALNFFVFEPALISKLENGLNMIFVPINRVQEFFKISFICEDFEINFSFIHSFIQKVDFHKIFKLEFSKI